MVNDRSSTASGEVIINGHNILEEPEKAKKCIGYLPEIPPLYLDMTVSEYQKNQKEPVLRKFHPLGS